MSSSAESPLHIIQDKISAASRGLAWKPKLLAVSKFQSVDAILRLYQEGQRDFGENYVQELLEKSNALKAMGITDIRWHFIGHLQTNKAKILLNACQTIHSIDSLKLATTLSQLAQKLTIQVDGWIQVNIDSDPSKSGYSEAHLIADFSQLSALAGLKLRGLMCIPTPGNTSAFHQIFELGKRLGLSEHSMGMSGDFEEAIQAGSHWVRIGSALFGARLSARSNK